MIRELPEARLRPFNPIYVCRCIFAFLLSREGLFVPPMHFRRRAGRFNRGKGFDNLISMP
jgi:hypothetical protein